MTPPNMRFTGSVLSAFMALLCILPAHQIRAQAADTSTIRRGLGPEPDSINIHQAQGLAAINLLRDLREGLVTFDRNGEPAPGQAASWQVFDGGKRYRFNLRPDARWSNGDPVTSSDFVRGWQRAFAADSQATTAGLLQGVVNADEIQIKVSQGAKPGHGGILPASKVTAEIAAIRGVRADRDVISPPQHSAFSSPRELLEFAQILRSVFQWLAADIHLPPGRGQLRLRATGSTGLRGQ